MLPRSLIFFYLAAGAAALQVIGLLYLVPYGPLLCGVLLNLGFAGLAVEPLVGSRSPVWLIAPAAWFGLYGWFAMSGQSELVHLRKTLETANAARVIAFDPARDTLALMEESKLDRRVSDFLETWPVNVVFDEDPGRRSRDGLPGYRGWRIAAAEVCALAQNEGNRKNLGIDWKPRGANAGGDCYVATPETPTRRLIEVRMKDLPVHAGLSGSQREVTLATPEGTTKLIGANLQRYPVIPLLAAGWPGFTGAGRGQGGSFLFFWTPYEAEAIGYGGGRADDLVLLARALSVTPSAGARPIPPAAEGLARIDALRAPKTDSPAALLDSFLRDPRKTPRREDIAILQKQSSILASRADVLAQAAARETTTPGGHSGAIMQSLVAALPATEFARVAPALMTQLVPMGTNSKSPRWGVDRLLIERIGDLGAKAVPWLGRMETWSGVNYTSVLLAYCRAGAPAAKPIETIVTRFATKEAPIADASPARRKALALAALRADRIDLADLIDRKSRATRFSGEGVNPDLTGINWSTDYPFWRATIGPGSSANVCDFPHAWYD